MPLGIQIARGKSSTTARLRAPSVSCHEGRLRRGSPLQSSSSATWWPWIRAILVFAVLLVNSLTAPGAVMAQTEADRESVRTVVERLFDISGEPSVSRLEVARHTGIWSVVIAQFAKGDTQEIDIPANVGERYQVVGGSESYETDVDICIYSLEGGQYGCDTLEDSYPVVTFTARTEGTYRAVMTAASLEGGTSSAGMVVLRLPDEGGGAVPEDSTTRGGKGTEAVVRGLCRGGVAESPGGGNRGGRAGHGGGAVGDRECGGGRAGAPGGDAYGDYESGVGGAAVERSAARGESTIPTTKDNEVSIDARRWFH